MTGKIAVRSSERVWEQYKLEEGKGGGSGKRAHLTGEGDSVLSEEAVDGSDAVKENVLDIAKVNLDQPGLVTL